MSDVLLPPDFAELESVIEWALPTEPERYAKRLASSMDELHAFYDVVAPRAREAQAHLDRIPLGDMPADARRLMWLLFSLINVSYPVEVFGRPRVPDGGAATVDRIAEPPTYPV